MFKHNFLALWTQMLQPMVLRHKFSYYSSLNVATYDDKPCNFITAVSDATDALLCKQTSNFKCVQFNFCKMFGIQCQQFAHSTARNGSDFTSAACKPY